MKENEGQGDSYSLEQLVAEFEKKGVRIIFSNLYFWAGVLFSLKDNWFCYINSRYPPRTQKWTLAHELGHFMLHQDFSYLFTDGMFPCAEVDAEWQANRFAAELLMPTREVLRALSEFPQDSLKRVFEISKKFDIPVAATAWWLRELNLISAKAYQYFLSAYREV
ncbi:ImmA/IrrE family metallo-endopeptidase [Thermanaerothrix sp.]|uniref:ImmA/IrrE family metallo-endopeptidase n=1 Tax=Thermanaerothrix sp. TaxID=2972675 RepID=UPI003C7C6CD8